MKLTKLKEARYTTGSTQIFVKKDFSYTNIGPFSSEEEANKFIEKIRSLSPNDVLKTVETQDPHDYLEEIVAKVKERTQEFGRRLGKKKVVRRRVPKKVKSLRSSRKKRTRKKSR